MKYDQNDLLEKNKDDMDLNQELKSEVLNLDFIMTFHFIPGKEY